MEKWRSTTMLTRNTSSLLAGLVLSFSCHVNDLRSIMKAYFDIEKQFRF